MIRFHTEKPEKIMKKKILYSLLTLSLAASCSRPLPVQRAYVVAEKKAEKKKTSQQKNVSLEKEQAEKCQKEEEEKPLAHEETETRSPSSPE
jgi:hypothetical protein